MPPQEQGKEQGIGGGDEGAVGYGRPPTSGRFQSGKSGNPGGRPKGRSLTTILRETLEKTEIKGLKLDNDGKTPGRTVAEALAEAMLAQAIMGNAAMAKLLFERLEGKLGESGSKARTLADLITEARATARAYRPEAPPDALDRPAD